ALLWNDVRSAPQAERLREELGAQVWADEIGIVPVPSFTITKLAWLAENHPDLADRVRKVMLPHDWLAWRILDRAGQPTTDRSDASGTGYYSVRDNAYRHDLLAWAFGRSPELPTVIGPAEASGTTAAGALVGAGGGDNAGAALGLSPRPGEVAVSIGTSGTVFTSTERTISDPSGAIAGFADATGQQLPLLATINGARVLTSTA
ncbi:xylulose kinase, partial [Arthrobacter deserti]|nr:xylulose kinase [Arthrobacter deserti]